MSTTTEDYMNTNTTEPDGGQSTATTPGLDLPGTFKKSWQNNEPSSSITETAQATLASAQYAAEQALLTAEQTAKHYLPQSVLDRLQGTPGKQNGTMLSEESESNFKPTHTGGVGSLPGGRNEEGMAQEDVKAKLANGRGSATAGVGSLPGERDEEGVAVLPHEKVTEANKYPPGKTSIDPPTDTSGQTKQLPSMVINDPAYQEESRKSDRATQQAAHPREHMSSTHPRSMEQTIPLPPMLIPDRDSSVDNASIRPLPPTPGQASADMNSLGTGVTVGSSAVSTTTETGNGNKTKNGHCKKPSFTQKLKGEVKVISGKLTKDQKKVEEGKAMKAGELLSHA